MKKIFSASIYPEDDDLNVDLRRLRNKALAIMLIANRAKRIHCDAPIRMKVNSNVNLHPESDAKARVSIQSQPR